MGQEEDVNYVIVLKNGRELKTRSYYEKDGFIYIVGRLGEMGFNKENVEEIRTEARESADGATTAAFASQPLSEDQCKAPGSLFQAVLRNLPSDRNQALADLDELIAREEAHIARLRGELPSLEARQRAAARQLEREREHRKIEARRAAAKKKEQGITGEDAIAMMNAASGMSQIVHAPVSKTVIDEGSFRLRKEAMEKELLQHRCNVLWANRRKDEIRRGD